MSSWRWGLLLMRSSRGQVGIVIFILVVVLVIAIILLIIYLNGRDEPSPRVENSSLNKTFFNITVGTNAKLLVNYQLANDTTVLLKGLLFANTQEDYKVGVEANTTVKLSAWSGDYYWNQTTCNISKNNFPCRVGLKLKALDFTVVLTNSSLVIDPLNRTIQAPVLVCFRETAHFANVILSLPLQTRVPPDLKATFDFCYLVERDITRRVSYPIDIHYNPFVPEPSSLSVLVRDSEQTGFARIGDKNASVFT